MQKFTKIVATLGPASDSVETITKLHSSGMNVARLNFSHGNHEYFTQVIARVRQVSNQIAIMLDTKGPEIRSGQVAGPGVMLKGGQEILLTNKESLCDSSSIYVKYGKLNQLPVGSKLLIDDGLLALEITGQTADGLSAKVMNGGLLKSNKTVCIQGEHVDLPFMSEQDRKDIHFGIANNLDFIAASFVRGAKDVKELRSLVNEHHSPIKLISKIEHGDAVANINDIIRESDGIMVARGDLGVEISLEKVPAIQSQIIKACTELGKPVIVATQMLESMNENPRPTRAEVSDVAQAIMQGADAIMLSGETASGKYPVESVEMMARIAREYDHRVHTSIEDNMHNAEELHQHSTVLFITKAAYHASRQLQTKAILTPTESGFTARKVSRFKPHCPIIALTSDMTTFRQLQLSWAVFPIFSPQRYASIEEMIRGFAQLVITPGLLAAEDLVVVTAGRKLQPGHTSLLQVCRVGDLLTKQD